MFEAHRLLWPTLWAVVFSTMTLSEVGALPASTSAPHTTHIVSYVSQGRANARWGEISEFDYESVQSGASGRSAALLSTEAPTPLSQLYGAFVEQLDMSLGNSVPSSNTTSLVGTSPPTSVNRTDDLLVTHRNTLEDADDFFGRNEQHESATTVKDNSHLQGPGGLMWHRMKQSIPVLEPVRHLLNTVRDQHNQTVHAARQHHQLLAAMKGGLGEHMSGNESSAIETEEDRETANESTEFKLLDFAGSFVSMLWSFIGNLQRIFAASSGNAFASSSGGQ
ncbi:uncharacterized protein LOC128856616 [Anastrepha ludens]|uniref:uncharacterized protein LOC128856616 n=1 Tax=Anastrepha ludens TaxID=28586 RepID=UPI0023B1F9E0|nr:uncharacterized protein LOC128856616 [Anastrepha ludens]